MTRRSSSQRNQRLDDSGNLVRWCQGFRCHDQVDDAADQSVERDEQTATFQAQPNMVDVFTIVFAFVIFVAVERRPRPVRPITVFTFQPSGREGLVLVVDWLVLIAALFLARFVCERCLHWRESRAQSANALPPEESFREEGKMASERTE